MQYLRESGEIIKLAKSQIRTSDISLAKSFENDAKHYIGSGKRGLTITKSSIGRLSFGIQTATTSAASKIKDLAILVALIKFASRKWEINPKPLEHQANCAFKTVVDALPPEFFSNQLSVLSAIRRHINGRQAPALNPSNLAHGINALCAEGASFSAAYTAFNLQSLHLWHMDAITLSALEDPKIKHSLLAIHIVHFYTDMNIDKSARVTLGFYQDLRLSGSNLNEVLSAHKSAFNFLLRQKENFPLIEYLRNYAEDLELMGAVFGVPLTELLRNSQHARETVHFLKNRLAEDHFLRSEMDQTGLLRVVHRILQALVQAGNFPARPLLN